MRPQTFAYLDNSLDQFFFEVIIIKFKFLTKNELFINLDRLSRFKHPEESYFRVFSGIILKNLITPKYSLHDIEKMDENELCRIVSLIWNKSVENIYGKNNKETNFNVLKWLCEYTFKNIDKKTKRFINAKLNINQILEDLNENSLPINL